MLPMGGDLLGFKKFISVDTVFQVCCLSAYSEYMEKLRAPSEKRRKQSNIKRMPLPIANAIASASQFNWLNELDRSLGVYCCILEVILSDKAELQQSGILETEVMT